LLERVFPQNKTQNASGQRRLKEDVQQIDEQAPLRVINLFEVVYRNSNQAD
jgi:hypothetical protein